MAHERVVVIGAGVGGLTTAAALSRAGHDVTVLEAHIYPGGCAGTFYHQGYRFDAGATLTGGFYPGGPMDLAAKATGVSAWPVRPVESAMTVHMPDGCAIERTSDVRRWQVREDAFGPSSLRFWNWQETTADLLWDFAMKSPPWPPQSLDEAAKLSRAALTWTGQNLNSVDILRRTPALLADGLRSVAAHLPASNERLRQFVDAQLLIASQTTSKSTNALYGASALDLPRRGVVQVEGGVGAIAETLARQVTSNGGSIRYRQEVDQIVSEQGRAVAVRSKKGELYDAGLIVANLTPWALRRLLGEEAPARLQKLPERPSSGGGAFMVYAGIDASAIPDSFASHHQIVVREPMGEGNTVFLSLSPEWDSRRAPQGRRALTISTHTQLEPWWRLHTTDKDAYELRKQEYAERMLSAVERVLPGIRDAADLILPANPVTFQRFTRRDWGWVGGFPQTNLFRIWGPQLGPNIWMVGDSIFPGQSIASVALGGLRVAATIHSVLA